MKNVVTNNELEEKGLYAYEYDKLYNKNVKLCHIRGFCKRDFNVRQYMLRFSSRLNLSKDKLKYKS